MMILQQKLPQYPECGATVDFPKNWKRNKMQSHGKTIYAQDFFEKVKGLL